MFLTCRSEDSLAEREEKRLSPLFLNSPWSSLFTLNKLNFHSAGTQSYFQALYPSRCQITAIVGSDREHSGIRLIIVIGICKLLKTLENIPAAGKKKKKKTNWCTLIGSVVGVRRATVSKPYYLLPFNISFFLNLSAVHSTTKYIYFLCSRWSCPSEAWGHLIFIRFTGRTVLFLLVHIPWRFILSYNFWYACMFPKLQPIGWLHMEIETRLQPLCCKFEPNHELK